MFYAHMVVDAYEKHNECAESALTSKRRCSLGEKKSPPLSRRALVIFASFYRGNDTVPGSGQFHDSHRRWRMVEAGSSIISLEL